MNSEDVKSKLRRKLVKILVQKDIADIFKSKNILLSMFFLPLSFAILFPTLMVGIPIMRGEIEISANIQFVVDIIPPLTDNWNILDAEQRYLIVLSFFPVIFLLMMPAILPSILASESVAGEKERNTLESLLATPLTDSEILLGKILSSAIPSILVVWLSCIPYVLLIDYFVYEKLGFLLLPDLRFLILLGTVAPLLVFASVTAMVWLSTRVKAARDAQQLSILIVLPLLTIVMVEIIGFMFSWLFLFIGILALAFIDLIAYYLVKRSFNREFLLSKI